MRLSAIPFLILCTHAPGQVTFSPSPTFATQEGNLTSRWFGSFASCRTQLADGSLRNQARKISGITYRSDYDNHSSASAVGRTWSNVALWMSEFDMGKIQRVPGANITGTPTLVHSGRTVWPSRSGLPPTMPAVTWTVDFPFRVPWSYSGKQDILADYTFRGGTLANQGPWLTTRYGPTVEYHLDSYNTGSQLAGSGITFGEAGFLRGCSDLGNKGPYAHFGAWTTLGIEHYGPGTSYPNRVRAHYRGQSFGERTTCITALGTRANPRGLSVTGVTCNRLYVDFTGPSILFANVTTTRGLGGTGYIETQFVTGSAPNYTVPVPAMLLGVPIICQTAWNDTKTRQLRLSSASMSWLPALSPWKKTTDAPRRSVYEFIHGPQLTQLVSAHEHMNPICAYR